MGRVLVTGGAGFIGSSLVEALARRGDEVHVVDDCSAGSPANLALAETLSGTVALHRVDICSPELAAAFGAARPELVFHLAAQVDVRRSVRDPGEDARVNVLGTLAVLEQCRVLGARVVFAASGGTLYGEAGEGQLPVDESAPQRPLSPYGVSKKSALDYLVAYRELHGLSSRALALANVYGPRQGQAGEAGVVGIFADRLRAGRPLTIYGDGEQTRDFVYVDDVAEAFVRAAELGEDGLYNIGTGIETSVNELHQRLLRLSGMKAPARRAPERPGELRRSALDASRAGRLLGWRPRTSLEEGLARVLASRPGSGPPATAS